MTSPLNDNTRSCLVTAMLVESLDITRRLQQNLAIGLAPAEILVPGTAAFSREFGSLNMEGLNTFELAEYASDTYAKPVLHKILQGTEANTKGRLEVMWEQTNVGVCADRRPSLEDFIAQHSGSEACADANKEVQAKERRQLRFQMAAFLVVGLRNDAIVAVTEATAGQTEEAFLPYAVDGKPLNKDQVKSAMRFVRYVAKAQVADAISIVQALEDGNNDVAAQRQAWLAAVKAGTERNVFNPSHSYVAQKSTLGGLSA